MFKVYSDKVGKEQEKGAQKRVKKIEDDLDFIYSQNSNGLSNLQEKMHIQGLEFKKLFILRKEAETWRQKSGAIWLAQGDANSKKNHKFVVFRRKYDTVWEIQNDRGECVKGQWNLKVEDLHYF